MNSLDDVTDSGSRRRACLSAVSGKKKSMIRSRAMVDILLSMLYTAAAQGFTFGIYNPYLSMLNHNRTSTDSSSTPAHSFNLKPKQLTKEESSHGERLRAHPRLQSLSLSQDIHPEQLGNVAHKFRVIQYGHLADRKL